ncbi:carotene biosynthesis protein [Halobacteriales archaeon QS_1_68_20]|nr:MAG: carotene biosynthesis protein [Halobacteriales archaeon QS_1_68_20]
MGKGTLESVDRAAVEGELERLVRENRVTVAVVFPLVGAVTLVASALDLLPAVLAYNPYLLLFGTLVMRSPLVAALVPLTRRRTGIWLGVLVAYSYAIEWVGLTTGWPYGEFEYVVDLGPMVAGVPVGLPVFFVPLVLNAYLLALLVTRGGRATLPLALAFVLAIDLVLDPAAVAIGFWAYPEGAYYGVPASNYLGWVLSGTVGVVAADRAFDRTALRERLAAVEFALDDLVSFVLLWATVNALFGQWVPVVVAAVLGVGLVWTGRIEVGRVRLIERWRTVKRNE